jgi:transglutaminase-like putative cysteine protease
MRYTAILLLMLILALTCNAQEKYDISLIPKELLSHASAVIRNDETIVDVKDLKSVIYHYKGAITILNKNGDDNARIVVEHDKLNKIRYIKGAIYNEFGKLSGKFSEGDFEDRNVADGFSLFNGDMVKHYKPLINTYPYTVEYDYEVNSKQSLFLEDWNPGQSTSVSVEHSSYKLLCKPDFNIRYKEINFPGKVESSEVAGIKTYLWNIDNLKALRNEPYSPDADKISTSVKMAPDRFSYDGISGSFTNWNEYGKWIYDKLLKDRKELPPETIAHIKEMTSNITDPKQKARVIYEYMQQKTHYISVQIGIGGYQPFLASDVDHQGYGDCKALVNYMQSLLSAAGIDSYYVLVKAGSHKKSALPDFASMNQFNHVILCLPFKNDTTWLECTSQQIPFGYLGEFTDDRNVVACTPEGGKLLHTPVFKPIDNKQIRSANFTLSSAGMLDGTMITRFEGAQYEYREELIKEPFKEQVKATKERYPIENLDIQSFDLKQDKGANPYTTETIKLQARDYVVQNSGRFSFTPNTASKYITPLKDVINRKNPVYINRGYLDEDNISYTLPDGYSISSKPLTLTIDKPFGKYSTSTQIMGNKLIYKRSLQINDGTFDKDTYADLMEFYQTIYEADRYTLTLEKK